MFMKKIALVSLAFLFTTALRTAQDTAKAKPVGFQIVSISDPQGSALDMGVWYPAIGVPAPRRIGLAHVTVVNEGPVAGANHPLVVISHGNEGAMGSHADTAMALAESGFVVAAPVHAGDNFNDQSAVGGPQWFIDRSRHIKAAIDYMLTGWPAHDRIDADRIGVFGFSAGGTTALIAIGGIPDFKGLAARCATRKELACSLWTAPDKGSGGLTRDRRIKAAVAAAPGFGFTFLPDGLKSITIPVQFWSGDADDNVPTATNTAPLHEALSAPSEYHLVTGAQHFSFIVPCSGPPICNDAPGFDRKAFHEAFNPEVVRFFLKKLN
jgi:predicted dienelactone hydrolase